MRKSPFKWALTRTDSDGIGGRALNHVDAGARSGGLLLGMARWFSCGGEMRGEG